MCRHRGDAEGGAEVERRPVRQRERPLGGHDREVRRRPERAAVLGEDQPDAVTDREARHAVSQGVDDAGAVLVRGHLVEGRQRTGWAFQSVGLTPERMIAHPDLTGRGCRHGSLDEVENRRGSGL